MTQNPFATPQRGANGSDASQDPFGGASNPFNAPSTSGGGFVSSSFTPTSSNPTTPNLFSGGSPGGGPNPTGGFSNPFASDGSDTENGFNTPGSSLLNMGGIPEASISQYQIPPEVQAMLDGKGGFSPETLANMKASGTESAAAAGQQQMAQVKRQMAQNGIEGSPAAAGYAGAVAHQTGEAQQAAARDVEMQNAQAQLSQQNMAAQLQAQAGMGNMQSANQMALANAQMLYNALLANQQARLQTQRTVAGM